MSKDLSDRIKQIKVVLILETPNCAVSTDANIQLHVKLGMFRL
jgi:hypothetical protein